MHTNQLLGGPCRIGAAATPLLLAAFAALLASSPARAELQICNQTHRALSIAIGYNSGADWVSEGWWNIDPRECRTVVGGDLKQRYYYYHASDPGFKNENYIFCTETKPFTIVGDTNCAARGFETAHFSEIDTGATATSYTFTLWEEIDENTPIGNAKTSPSSRSGDTRISPSPNSGGSQAPAQVSSNDYASIAKALIGWWSSVEEPSQVGFIDSSTMDYTYDGEYVDTFDYRLDNSCPDGSGVDDVQLILVSEKTGEQSCYGIVDLTFNELTLRFLPDGNLLHHNRVE